MSARSMMPPGVAAPLRRFGARLFPFDNTAAHVRRLGERIFPFVVVAVVWELCARLQVFDPLFLPRFSGAVGALYAGLFESGVLVTDMLSTLTRAFVGLMIGAGVGIVLGTLMGQFRPVRQFLDPLVSFLFPMPKLVFFPLLMVLLGLSEWSKITVIALSAFFPVVINTYTGIRSVDKFLIWNALSKGANQWQLLTRVLIPAAMPFILTGLRVSASLAFLIAVTVEMLQSNNGLGYRILFARSIYEPEIMFAALLLVALLGFSVDRLVRIIGRRLLVWQETIE